MVATHAEEAKRQRKIAVYKRRLLKLADYLDTVKPEEFSMRHWKTTLTRSEPCGTVCCAGGHAASMKAFRDLGLGLKRTLGGAFDIVLRPNKKNGLKGGARWSWCAIDTIFGTEEPFGACYDHITPEGTYDRNYKRTPQVHAAWIRSNIDKFFDGTFHSYI